jgi:hypothetical protein
MDDGFACGPAAIRGGRVMSRAYLSGYPGRIMSAHFLVHRLSLFVSRQSEPNFISDPCTRTFVEDRQVVRHAPASASCLIAPTLPFYIRHEPPPSIRIASPVSADHEAGTIK